MKAIEIINQWDSMTGEEQYTFCKNCVKRELKMGRRLKAGIEFDDAVQGTAERVLTVLASTVKLDADTVRRESQGKAANTLVAVVCRAAHATVERMAYHDAKDSVAANWTISDDEGHEIDVLDTIAATENIEDAAIFRATLQQFVKSLDEINQKILSWKINGLTERELAPIVGISHVAVHKRLAKMQKELKEMI